ncbi:LOW QUALITY PROTEIN: hypothetical protein TorRG33x02_200510 [Trema orientale]|uniref:Uncharacterized protein n=1 Tax=Trema orientale TaxID=63057 RepID=A0A2P5EF33_TREOI|nr:LOW QUALITY PROTEIN: hypothetical protein TorRG33x02_200510 [Trema orientale]
MVEPTIQQIMRFLGKAGNTVYKIQHEESKTAPRSTSPLCPELKFWTFMEISSLRNYLEMIFRLYLMIPSQTETDTEFLRAKMGKEKQTRILISWRSTY